MSSPRDWWWASVKAAIRQYPKLREKKDNLQAMSITASAGPGGSAGTQDGRKTERYALRQLPPAEEKALEAVEKARCYTANLPDGACRLKMIELYYFKGLRLSEAAQRVYIDERTAKRWNGIFVRLVAGNLEYLERSDTVGRRPH